MPRPNQYGNAQEAEAAKGADLKKLFDAKIVNMKVNEKKEPVLFKIKTLLSTDEGRKKQDDITKLCFDWLLDNKDDAYSKTKRDRYNDVLNALGIVDAKLATYVQDVVNKDKTMAKQIENKKTEPLDVFKVLDKTKTRWHNTHNTTYINEKSDKDPRIENLKEMLKRFKSKEVSPWHHINRDVFNKMIKSIERTIEYSKAIDKGVGTEEVLDKLFDDVKENTLKYLKAKSDTPDSKYGKSRINLALATLLSVDKEKGLQAIDQVATDRLQRLEKGTEFLADLGLDPNSRRISKSSLMSLDRIIKETGFKDFDTRETMTQALDQKMKTAAKEVNDPEWGVSTPSLAEYVVYKFMSELLQKMTQSEARKFDVSDETLKEQSKNVLISDPFEKACDKVIGTATFKRVKPNEFYIVFKIEYVNHKEAEAAKQAAEAEKASKRMGDVKVKSPEEMYSEVKKNLKLDENAKFDEVSKALRKEMMKNHPDKHPENRAEVEAKFKELSSYQVEMKKHEEELRMIDNNPSRKMEMKKPAEEIPMLDNKPAQMGGPRK